MCVCLVVWYELQWHIPPSRKSKLEQCDTQNVIIAGFIRRSRIIDNLRVPIVAGDGSIPKVLPTAAFMCCI